MSATFCSFRIQLSTEQHLQPCIVTKSKVTGINREASQMEFLKVVSSDKRLKLTNITNEAKCMFTELEQVFRKTVVPSAVNSSIPLEGCIVLGCAALKDLRRTGLPQPWTILKINSHDINIKLLCVHLKFEPRNLYQHWKHPLTVCGSIRAYVLLFQCKKCNARSGCKRYCCSMMCLEIFGTRDSIQLSTCCLEFFISLLRQEHFVLLILCEPRPCHHRLTSLLKVAQKVLC